MFNEVIKRYDCKVLEGHRGEGAQNAAYAAGNSKLRFPHSTHNSMPSRGVDVAPYPIDWDNTKRFYHFAGFVRAVSQQMGIGVRWGGDWDGDLDLDDQDFNDLVHWELLDSAPPEVHITEKPRSRIASWIKTITTLKRLSPL